MLPRLCFILVLLTAVPLWAQTGYPATTTDNSQASSAMLLPPPVSGAAYPSEVGAEITANFLRGGLTFSGGYVNNLYPGTGVKTADDTLITVEPHIVIDHTAPRSHELLTYTPSFMFYSPDSVLNTANQTVAAAFQYQLSPHVDLLANDSLKKTTTTLGQPSAYSQGSVSGSLPSGTPGLVAPFAPQITNSVHAILSWQFTLNDMMGGGGYASQLSFTNPQLARGLYNSHSEGGSGFYTHRLTQSQYLGATFRYAKIEATPFTNVKVASAGLQTDDVLGFYTVYFRHSLSLSLGGGPERYNLTQPPAAMVQAWAPAAFASLGGQSRHTSFAVSYSRVVTGGDGVIGGFESDAADASGRWQLLPNWTLAVEGNYSQIKTVSTSIIAGSVPGGHTLAGSASVNHHLGPYLDISFQYQRLHQSYENIAAIATNPDSNYEFGSISYHFSRPLGR